MSRSAEIGHVVSGNEALVRLFSSDTATRKTYKTRMNEQFLNVHLLLWVVFALSQIHIDWHGLEHSYATRWFLEVTM